MIRARLGFALLEVSAGLQRLALRQIERAGRWWL